MRRGCARGVALSAMLVCGVSSAPWPAFAEDQGPMAAVPTDVVKLKDGSLYRGTIMELVAGDHVDLRLTSGEVKRFDMGDVKYAGSASDLPGASPRPPREAPSHEPPAPRPLVTVEADAARIHFESDTPDTDFHIRTGEATVSGVGWGGRGAFVYNAVAHGYEHICAAPCQGTLPTGRHRLAISYKGKAPIEPAEPVAIDGPSTVRGSYEDNHGTRVTGWLIFGTGMAAGTIMMAIGLTQTTQDCTDQAATGFCYTQVSPNGGLIGGGLVVMGVGTVLGLVLALKHDHATIEVTPIDTALPSHLPGRREAAWIASDSPLGLGMRARF